MLRTVALLALLASPAPEPIKANLVACAGPGDPNAICVVLADGSVMPVHETGEEAPLGAPAPGVMLAQNDLSLPVSPSSTPAAAPSPVMTPPQDLTGAVGFVSLIVDAYKAGNVTLLVALVLSLLVFVVKRYVMTGLFVHVPEKWDPWITVGLTVAGSVATGVFLHQDLVTSLLGGLGAGWMALGAEAHVGQHAPDPIAAGKAEKAQGVQA